MADVEVSELAKLNLNERGARDSCVAILKSEFIIQKEDNEQQPREEAKPKKERRGMNKNRKRDMKHADTFVRTNAVRLCSSVIQPVPCKFGERCTSEHDVQKFLKEKPADINESCPVFDVRGLCPFSYACRFGGAHVDEKGEQISKEPDVQYDPTLNSSSMSIQVGLRKKTYNFGLCDEAMESLKEGKICSMEPEPRILDMRSLKGKKFLAPLTTVGNLPFRRLCVDFGAEITCSEMIVATNLLTGSASEYSLLKRHPSEKIFGVQLAGGYADTMSKAAQIVVDNFKVDFIDINMGCPIDLINQKGGGCALPNRPSKLVEVISTMKRVMRGCPLTVKLRTGLKEGQLKTHETVALLRQTPMTTPDMVTLHSRSKEQRYSHLAHWEFTKDFAGAAGDIPFWACGDVLSWQDYYDKMEKYPVEGVMIGRGALIKPWLFTEIDERRTWDIAATARLDILKKFVNYGLDHWGSDDSGVERTRKFLLELLSFQCRYIPVGLLESPPQKINERPPRFRGRNELETLLSSFRADDWIEISRMLLGPTPEGFTFIPKHKASSY